MSLYLEYRPKTLADVIGQEHIVQTLQNAIKKDKLAHAYLFTGSRGTGKTSTARIIAKYILTHGIEDEAITNQIIKGVEEGNMVDLIEIDGASNRNIDDIRNLKEQIQFSPVVAAAKVYIIDEVHMFTKEAFNALLKTLEEPPKYAYFILATTELHKIPVTIQSRCQTFPFRRIDAEDIIQRLQYIADTEKITISREAVRAIAHHVNGGMRDAISLLDQLQSLESIEKEDVYSRIGGMGTELAQETWYNLTEQNKPGIAETLKTLQSQSLPVDVFVQQLLTITREELFKQSTQNQDTSFTEQVMEGLLQCLQQLRSSPIPLLPLELALLKLVAGANPVSSERPKAPEPKVEVPKTEAKEEPKVAKTKSEEAKPAEAPKVAEESTPSAEFTSEELSLDLIKSVWENVVQATTPAAAKMSLKNAQIIGLDGNTLTLGFSSSFHKDKVTDTEASRNIEALLQKQTGATIRLRCTEEFASSQTSTPDEDMVDTAAAASEIF